MKDLPNEEIRTWFKASEIARHLGVTSHAVLKWIKSGKLDSYATPGGHHRVRSNDLRTFLTQYRLPIDEGFFRRGPAPRTMLVVTSDARMRGDLRRLLTELDPSLRLEWADELYEAGIKIGSLIPDIVMLDLTAPGAETAAFCRSLRSHSLTRRIGILVLIDITEPLLVRMMVGAGADLCVPKPFDYGELRRRLAAALQTVIPSSRADRTDARGA
jgi:excisionase family DNA binding protein